MRSNFGREERGGALVLVAIWLGAIVSLSALAIDGGSLLRSQSKLRYAYQAASLRGASMLSDGETSMAKIESVVRAVTAANLELEGMPKSAATNAATALTVKIDQAAHQLLVFGSSTQQLWFAQALPGAPSEHAVSASAAAGALATTSSEAGSEGRFEFQGIPEGTFLLEAAHPTTPQRASATGAKPTPRTSASKLPDNVQFVTGLVEKVWRPKEKKFFAVKLKGSDRLYTNWFDKFEAVEKDAQAFEGTDHTVKLAIVARDGANLNCEVPP